MQPAAAARVKKPRSSSLRASRKQASPRNNKAQNDKTAKKASGQSRSLKRQTPPHEAEQANEPGTASHPEARPEAPNKEEGKSELPKLAKPKLANKKKEGKAGTSTSSSSSSWAKP